MQPTIGRIVLVPMIPSTNNGAPIAPAIITRVWEDGQINVRVIADSNNHEWRTSLTYSDDLSARADDPVSLRHWTWPPRV